MVEKNKNEVKLVIFLDDDGTKKEKPAKILKQSDYWVEIQLWDIEKNCELKNKEGEIVQPFELTASRVLKIKKLNLEDRK